MARITRKLQKIFALNSSDNGQFGSARAGTKVQTTDVEVLQALTAYGDGWNAATISSAKLPTLEEMQGLQYGLSYQIAYLMQEGIAEYQAATAYYIDSIVKEPGTVKLYASLTNNNVGNALSNATHWRLLVDLEIVQPLNNFTATVNPTVNDDAGDGYSAGSTWYNTVGADLFMCVDATVGAAVWVDTGVDLSDLGALAFLNTVGTTQINDGAVTAAKVGSDVATTAGTQTLTNKTVNGVTLTAAGSASNVLREDGTYGAINQTNKVWVNFNGTGTVSIRASFNVTSITDNGVGDYTVNITSALADANYAAVGSSGVFAAYGTGAVYIHRPYSYTASAYRFLQGTSGNSAGAGSPLDSEFTNVALFR